MSQTEKKRLGDVLFQDIDDNDYLNELYKNILYNYAITILQITNIKQLRGINVDDALRFADAGSGESNARRYLFENDLVEAIIPLPHHAHCI